MDDLSPAIWRPERSLAEESVHTVTSARNVVRSIMTATVLFFWGGGAVLK